MSKLRSKDKAFRDWHSQEIPVDQVSKIGEGITLIEDLFIPNHKINLIILLQKRELWYQSRRKVRRICLFKLHTIKITNPTVKSQHLREDHVNLLDKESYHLEVVWVMEQTSPQIQNCRRLLPIMLRP